MQKSVYESLIIFGNQGFIGFAISYILMAEQGIIYLTFFNICYLILIWSYGIYLFTKNMHSVEWRSLFFNPGILSTFIGLGMLFLPLFLFVFFLFNVSYQLIIIAVLTSAMPSASTTSIYAQKFGGDTAFASFGVLLTTLLCMLTIPLLYSLLQWLHPIFN